MGTLTMGGTLHTGGDARELRQRDGRVGDDERQHRERRKAHAILLANERRKALARDAAHTRGGLLHDDEQEAHHRDTPQLLIAKDGAGV